MIHSCDGTDIAQGPGIVRRQHQATCRALAPTYPTSWCVFGVEALHKFGAPMIFEDGVPVQLSVQMLRRHLNPDMLAHGFEMAASSNQVKHKSRVNSVPAAIEPSLCFGEETWASKKDTSVPSASSGRVLANAERPQESSTSTGHDTSGECTEASISEGTWDGVTSSPTGLDELNVSSYWRGNMRVWQL